MDGIRELEDLIIEGTNCNVMRGKLDQKSSHFEVDWAMGRDIRKVNKVLKPLSIRGNLRAGYLTKITCI